MYDGNLIEYHMIVQRVDIRVHKPVTSARTRQDGNEERLCCPQISKLKTPIARTLYRALCKALVIVKSVWILLPGSYVRYSTAVVHNSRAIQQYLHGATAVHIQRLALQMCGINVLTRPTTLWAQLVRGSNNRPRSRGTYRRNSYLVFRETDLFMRTCFPTPTRTFFHLSMLPRFHIGCS